MKKPHDFPPPPGITLWDRLVEALPAFGKEKEKTPRAAQGTEDLPPEPLVVWLVGKTQSGKSTIVHALTGAPEAKIGTGFKACTRTAHLFDFPAENPLLRFLDTRGLGEVSYDPAEDMAACEKQAHLVLAVMRAGDMEQDAVFNVLRRVRERPRQWPVIIAQTCLHQTYPSGQTHALPYPFEDERWAEKVSSETARLLSAQRILPGAPKPDSSVHWVPIDFTQEGDGYLPREYGMPALLETLSTVAGLRFETLLREANDERCDIIAAPLIWSYARRASVLGAIPVADTVGLTALQVHMLRRLAALYNEAWNRRMAAEFVAIVGLGMGVTHFGRLGANAIIKMVPGIGQTAGIAWGSASALASTYALGKAGAWYLSRRTTREGVSVKNVREIYDTAFRKATTLRNRTTGKPPAS